MDYSSLFNIEETERPNASALYKMVGYADSPAPHTCVSCGLDFNDTNRRCIIIGYPIDYYGVPALCRVCFIAMMKELRLGYTYGEIAKTAVANTKLSEELDTLYAKIGGLIDDFIERMDSLRDLRFTSDLGDEPDLFSVEPTEEEFDALKDEPGSDAVGEGEVNNSLAGLFGGGKKAK